MAGVLCPQCGQKMAYVQELAGNNVSCPTCRARFEMPVLVVEPPVISPPRAVIEAHINYPAGSHASIAAFKPFARMAILFGALGSMIGVGFGLLLSQFMPFYGGFLVQVAEPFSPARIQVAMGHAIVMGMLGAFGGALFGASMQLFSEH